MTGHAASGAGLQIHDGRRIWSFLADRVVRVGRDPAADVPIPLPEVSRRHLELLPTATSWLLLDVGSQTGLWLGNQRLERIELAFGDTVQVRLGSAPGATLTISAVAPTAQAHPTRTVITLGRGVDNDVVLNDPLASRRHAQLDRAPAGVLVRDLNSFNGTYVNGRRVEAPHPLRPGDVLGIGSSALEWNGEVLRPAAPAGPALRARHLTVRTRTGKVLLSDVSLSIPPASLVAVIGPSGAGKSTLLGALTGLRPAGIGTVTWKGRDLYANYDEMRSGVGLVPQEDILHPQLTVRRALRFAAALRFPPDMTDDERTARIAAVLTDVGLLEQADQRIDSLSGGQRKRTSIALELLTAPPLLFLDEPTSGLDPGLDLQVMTELRRLADGGRVMVVVTHSVLALGTCDLVLLLAPGGKTAYYGPPDQLVRHFGVTDYPAVFTALADPAWPNRFAGSELERAHVGPTGVVSPAKDVAVAAPPRRSGPLRQLGTLIARNVAVAAADRTLLALLVGMPVALAALAQVVPGEAGISMATAGGRFLEAQQRLLILVLGGALMGAALTVRELVKERAIYRRERAVGQSAFAYLASKVIVLGSLVALQSVGFTLLALLGLPGPDDPLVLPSGTLEVAVAVAGVAVALAVAGLAVSAAVRTADQTMPALVGLIMAQLVLCGGLIPLDGRVGLEQLAWLAPARFGFAAAAATSGLYQPGVPTVGDPLFEPTVSQWWTNIGVLALQIVVLILLTAWALARSVKRREVL